MGDFNPRLLGDSIPSYPIDNVMLSDRLDKHVPLITNPSIPMNRSLEDMNLGDYIQALIPKCSDFNSTSLLNYQNNTGLAITGIHFNPSLGVSIKIVYFTQSSRCEIHLLVNKEGEVYSYQTVTGTAYLSAYRIVAGIASIGILTSDEIQIREMEIIDVRSESNERTAYWDGTYSSGLAIGSIEYTQIPTTLIDGIPTKESMSHNQVTKDSFLLTSLIPNPELDNSQYVPLLSSGTNGATYYTKTQLIGALNRRQRCVFDGAYGLAASALSISNLRLQNENGVSTNTTIGAFYGDVTVELKNTVSPYAGTNADIVLQVGNNFSGRTIDIVNKTSFPMILWRPSQGSELDQERTYWIPPNTKFQCYLIKGSLSDYCDFDSIGLTEIGVS